MDVDALTCPACGGQLKPIAVINEPDIIRKILQHLDLWERTLRSPPRELLTHKLESFLASLTPKQAQQVRASSDSFFFDDVPVFDI